MKKVGLVGGISWVSTMDYYKAINEGINAKLGGLEFAECVIESINFGELQRIGWLNAFDLLLTACKRLEASGVAGIALCANTAHLYAKQLQASLSVPLIDIISETAKAIRAQGLKQVGLLGTKWTMEMDFYRNRMEEFALAVMVPEPAEARDYIQHTLKEELGAGHINPATKAKYIAITNTLIARGADCVVFGCTEIPLLLSQADVAVPAFDSTQIHCQSIVEFMLN